MGIMRIGGESATAVVSLRRLAQCLLFFGALALLVVCLLGMHSISSMHGTPPVEPKAATEVVAVDSCGSVMTCPDLGEQGSGGSLMLLCGMVMIAVFGMVATRAHCGSFLSRLRRLLLRAVFPRSLAPPLVPSLTFLSISRT
ncbi:hypothetical protein HNR05_000344 [Leifsonia psychrotolerans]|uniref:Uncharacterized protein n=1 Tax=Glaciibacter psychrotolerans TaxID=670054 RepID=A0A7Z0EBN5_9MICO|nr:hypothetical protein [Leifsonia psychrotolerans]